MADILRNMEFIETPTFTRLLASLLTDDEYRALQNVLVENPARGDLIPGGGGIRKLRHALSISVQFFPGISVQKFPVC